LYSVSSVEELQNLNPYIVIGCGGGGEKFSNLEGIETVGYVDDAPEKQGKPFMGFEVASSLLDLMEKEPEAKSIVIMLPIGAEGAALKYAVQAIDAGKNVVCSFRSLSIQDNLSLAKFANQNGVTIKEIGPRLDVIDNIFGIAPEKSTEILPKISYTPKAKIVFCGGSSQECGKRTTTRNLGIAATKRGMVSGVISTDEMGLEQPTDFNFRAGSLSAMDIPSAILGSIKYLEETKHPDIIFIEGQSSLTEDGNPHPRGLSAAILIGAHPDAVIVGHRPNHPFREPRGIKEEIKAIEAVEPTKVVGISINLRNEPDKTPQDYEDEFSLPTADVRKDPDKLLDAILNYFKKE